jgi:predicted enzyme related to lactoylglutathione lyase
MEMIVRWLSNRPVRRSLVVGGNSLVVGGNSLVVGGNSLVVGGVSRAIGGVRSPLVIVGAHAIISTDSPEAMRAFFRDVLELPFVDAGGGWLIFALPPAELAVHPADRRGHALYLMCDDIERTVEELTAKGVEFTRGIDDVRWGRLTALRLPDGSELCLYEPKHASPVLPGR